MQYTLVTTGISPFTRRTVSGSMYLGTSSARSWQVAGTSSDGLRSTQLPAAMAFAWKSII